MVQSLLNSVGTRDPNQSLPGFTAHPSSFLLSKLRSTAATGLTSSLSSPSTTCVGRWRWYRSELIPTNPMVPNSCSWYSPPFSWRNWVWRLGGMAPSFW